MTPPEFPAAFVTVGDGILAALRDEPQGLTLRGLQRAVGYMPVLHPSSGDVAKLVPVSLPTMLATVQWLERFGCVLPLGPTPTRDRCWQLTDRRRSRIPKLSELEAMLDA